jgi:hypothetical protein
MGCAKVSRCWAVGVASFCLLSTVQAPNAAAADAQAIDFNRDIRPLLSDRCFACHGPDEEDRQAGLRLDDFSAATAELDSGLTAIVPGTVSASELLTRITSDDLDVVMPPPEVGKPITPGEAALLADWIAEGAVYRGHWGFQRIERPAVPAVADTAWPLTPIDRFILTRLEQEGLHPNGEADRTTLARRLALDLTGLPPEPTAVAAFLADDLSEAYSRYVDQLLASPHYGERMAIEWLDAARYADSHGYQTDSSRSNWPWRNWVIEAFNRNLPFDQFTVEQLAGDMLPESTRDQIVATGFNRNHRINGEGGIIAEEWRVETVIDRVETTGQTWLGLTVGCARCHDHKYDPISQREFYELFAIFNNVPETGTIMGQATQRSGGNAEPIRLLPTAAQEKKLAQLEEQVVDAKAALTTEEKNLKSLAEVWAVDVREALRTAGEAWQPFEPLEMTSAGGASFRRSEDGSWLVEGVNPPQDSYTAESLIPAGRFSGLRLELLPVAGLAGGGFGRGGNGNVVVTKIEAEIDPPGDGKAIPVVFKRAEATYQQKGWEAAKLLSAKKGDGWAIDGNRADIDTPRTIALLSAQPVVVPENSHLVVTVRQESQFTGHTIARFRLAYSADEPSLLGVNGLRLPKDVRAAVMTATERRTPKQQKEVEAYYRGNVAGPIRQAEAARDAAQKSLQDFRNTLPSAMVMREGPPREAFVLERGEYDKRGEQVPPGLPAFLPALPDGEQANRLALARWIVSRDNPLTARVWVNRIWERFFGVGLVKTSENLGNQAAYPSHPELLDWLAAEFIESGWDMKRFIKLLVTSRVYRQAATVTPAELAKDPENRLLARASRIRLPAEVVRDAALASSGLLVPTIGGPSVRPWMPDGVWDETSKYGNLRGYKPAKNDDRYRRSMYTIWKRTAGPPTMLLFDAPNRETCTVKRSRTNTPLQALALLNETTFIEAAHGLAKRMVAEGGDQPGKRIAYGFQVTMGRQPTTLEQQTLTEGLAADLALYTQHAQAAEQLATAGIVPRPDGVPLAEYAAYTLAANVILNLDEFIMRE